MPFDCPLIFWYLVSYTKVNVNPLGRELVCYFYIQKSTSPRKSNTDKVLA